MTAAVVAKFLEGHEVGNLKRKEMKQRQDASRATTLSFLVIVESGIRVGLSSAKLLIKT
jgi:hypothetical protein